MKSRKEIHLILRALTGKTCIGEVGHPSGRHAAACDAIRALIDRERERIRRKQASSLSALRSMRQTKAFYPPLIDEVIHYIDAATQRRRGS